MVKQFSGGLTLIELMITSAVIGIIIALALPAYQDYIATARESVLNDNIQTIRLMQDERRRDSGEYVEGDYVPGGSTTLSTRLGWIPRTTKKADGTDYDFVTYEVECITDGAIAGECARTSGYTVTATHSEAAGAPVIRTYSP